MKSIIEQLEDFVYTYNINRAYMYKEEDIKYVGKSTFNKEEKFDFIVNDKDSSEKQIVKIGLEQKVLSSVYCSCMDFKNSKACEHIAAVVMNNQDILSPSNHNDYIIEKSKEILNIFSKKKSLGTIKQKLNVEYTFTLVKTYWSKEWSLKFKIGLDKLYAVGPKYHKFINSFYNQEATVEFGKLFIYDPQKYFFSKEDEEILRFLYDNCNYHQGELRINSKDICRFLKLFSEKEFYIYNVGLIKGIDEGIPFNITLNKEKENYILDVNINKSLIPLTSNCEYILYEKQVYHLNKEYANLLKVLLEDEIQTLVFKEEDLRTFNEGLLPIIRKDIEVSEDLKEFDLDVKPDIKLYFDIDKEQITCKIIFNYNGQEVDYFDKSTNLLRDLNLENNVLNELVDYNFQIQGSKIILQSLELIVNFLENEIHSLAEKYDIFTSEELKKVNVKKKLKISSMFSIGKDNILHYDFDLDDISQEELKNVIASLKSEKKYHRLKNGEIINLEDESLNELNDLIEDLDLSLADEEHIIPKYKAIYLDSLKSSKYSNIKTNNLFDEFITKFKNNIDVNVTFTNEEKQTLRNYQQYGVQWLYKIHKCDLGGILADEMGLGKSIQTIYFIKKLLQEDKKSKFLIVCPTALVYNWLNEFQKFAKEITVDVLIGYKNQRLQKLKDYSSDVFITSYGTLREDIDEYQDKIFKVCIIDEAQNIKNPLSISTKQVKKIQADTKLALTGTPLENSVTEIWSIFDFIMPGFLSSATRFNKKYQFQNFNDDVNKELDNLKSVIAPFILRRKKKDVAKELPEKLENNIFIDLGKEQRKYYASEIKKVQEEMDLIIQNEGFNKSKLYILQLLTKLRQICIDPRLVVDNYQGESAKIENLLKLVVELINNNHKILLFTSFKKSLDIVKKKFEKEGITYYVIDGSVPSKIRQELVEKFNQDETNVFLITLKSGGTGLNLTSADIVIHLDLWWNPQAENQATDRAHRIGQKNTVEVIKLIAKGTIEERILELQKKKQALSDKLIEKGQSSQMELTQLSEEDVRSLLIYENMD